LANIHETDYKHFALGAHTNALHFIPKFRHNAMADGSIEVRESPQRVVLWQSLALEFIADEKRKGKHKPFNPDFCARESY
jgi:hypothetical protein